MNLQKYAMPGGEDDTSPGSEGPGKPPSQDGGNE